MEILEDLWNGQIRPALEPGYQDEEYHDLEKLFASNEDKLRPTLNQAQQEDLQKMKAIWEDMERISQCAAFIKGFQLAVRIMAASV